MRRYTFYSPDGTTTTTYEADGDSLQPSGTVVLFNKNKVSKTVATDATQTDIVTVFSPHHYRNYTFTEIEKPLVEVKAKVLKLNG